MNTNTEKWNSGYMDFDKNWGELVGNDLYKGLFQDKVFQYNQVKSVETFEESILKY